MDETIGTTQVKEPHSELEDRRFGMEGEGRSMTAVHMQMILKDGREGCQEEHALNLNEWRSMTAGL